MRKSLVTLVLAMGVVLVPGLGVVGGLAYADEPAEPVMVLSPEYPVAGASEECWAALLDAGFRGRPGDGKEALYVPAGQLRKLCSDDR